MLTPDVSNPCSARSICQNVSPTYKKREISKSARLNIKYVIPGCQLAQPVMWMIIIRYRLTDVNIPRRRLTWTLTISREGILGGDDGGLGKRFE